MKTNSIFSSTLLLLVLVLGLSGCNTMSGVGQDLEAAGEAIEEEAEEQKKN